jgi:hypothetical protein
MKTIKEINGSLEDTRTKLRSSAGRAMQSSYLEGWLDALKWVKEAKE